jgi:hypothetical protein
MGSPITWRDIQAPDAGSANSLIAQSSRTFNDAFSGINDLLTANKELIQNKRQAEEITKANVLLSQLANVKDPNKVALNFTGLGNQGANVANFLAQAKNNYYANLATQASIVEQEKKNAVFDQNNSLANSLTQSEIGLNSLKGGGIEASTNIKNIEAGYLPSFLNNRNRVKGIEANAVEKDYEAKVANDYFNTLARNTVKNSNNDAFIKQVNANYAPRNAEANLDYTNARTYSSRASGRAALQNARANMYRAKHVGSSSGGSTGGSTNTNLIGAITQDLSDLERKFEGMSTPPKAAEKNKFRLYALSQKYGNAVEPSTLKSIIGSWGKGDKDNPTKILTALDKGGAGSNISAGDDRAKIAQLQTDIIKGTKSFELADGTKMDLSKIPFSKRKKVLGMVNTKAKALAEDNWFNYRPYDATSTEIKERLLDDKALIELGVPVSGSNNPKGLENAVKQWKKSWGNNPNLTGQAARIQAKINGQ